MTNEEFSNEFDVLVDSYRRFKSYDDKEELDSIEFNEYEKSVFLTKAQEEIILELYSGNYNGYEQTEEIRQYLASLNKETILNTTSASTTSYLKRFNKLEYNLPTDVWFITFEAVETTTNTLAVTPVNRDSLYKTLQNPFKISSNRCVRVDGVDNKIYIIGKELTGAKYEIHYLVCPTPIVLVKLNNNVSINGVNIPTECKIHAGLHNKILERAVALALQSKVIVNNKND